MLPNRGNTDGVPWTTLRPSSSRVLEFTPPPPKKKAGGVVSVRYLFCRGLDSGDGRQQPLLHHELLVVADVTLEKAFDVALGVDLVLDVCVRSLCAPCLKDAWEAVRQDLYRNIHADVPRLCIKLVKQCQR